MKLLFAECCGDIVAPNRKDTLPRHCNCGKAAVWWGNGAIGELWVWSSLGPKSVSVLGLHNSLLTQPYKQLGEGLEFGCIQADVIREILEQTPSSYVFKQVGSLIIKVRPGFTSDIKFEDEATYRKLARLDK
jgi:hypothetical protein